MIKRKSQEIFGFGLVIDYYLTANEMSQADLARKLKVSRSAVTKWMKGENLFKMEHLEKMLEIFKIDFKDFAETAHKETSWGKFSRNYPH